MQENINSNNNTIVTQNNIAPQVTLIDIIRIFYEFNPFLIESFKPNAIQNWVNTKPPEDSSKILAFGEAFLNELRKSQDTRITIPPNPVNCFILTIEELRQKRLEPIHNFLLANPNFTKFLKLNRVTLLTIMDMWSQDNKNAHSSQVPHPKFTVVEFISENKKFFILNILKFICQKTPEYEGYYQRWLKDNGITIEEQESLLSKNVMILEPLVPGLLDALNTQNALNRENPLTPKNSYDCIKAFIALTLSITENTYHDEFNRFLNENEHVKEYLSNNLPNLISLKEVAQYKHKRPPTAYQLGSSISRILSEVNNNNNVGQKRQLNETSEKVDEGSNKRQNVATEEPENRMVNNSN